MLAWKGLFISLYNDFLTLLLAVSLCQPLAVYWKLPNSMKSTWCHLTQILHTTFVAMFKICLTQHVSYAHLQGELSYVIKPKK